MPFMDEYRTALLNHIFCGTDKLTPTTIYIGLHVGDDTQAHGGPTGNPTIALAPTNFTNFNEPTGGNYARASIPVSPSSWQAPFIQILEGSMLVNNIEVVFPKATATWGTITHFGFFTHQDSIESLFAIGELSTPINVSNGDTFIFDLGDLQVFID